MIRSFIIFQSGEKLTSFTKNNRANFSVKKKKKKITIVKLFGVYIRDL